MTQWLERWSYTDEIEEFMGIVWTLTCESALLPQGSTLNFAVTSCKHQTITLRSAKATSLVKLLMHRDLLYCSTVQLVYLCISFTVTEVK